MDSDPPPYNYLAYTDEAGYPGLRRVKPLSPNGSSEWIVIAGAQILAEFESEMKEWIAELLAVISSRQLRDVHFQRLNDRESPLNATCWRRKRCAYSLWFRTSKIWRGTRIRAPHRYRQPTGSTIGLLAFCWGE